MSRDLSTVTLENIESDVVYPFFAVELLFDGANTLRMWTGQGTLVLQDGTQWVGAGSILDISAIEETAEMAVKGATIAISGLSSEALSLALSEPYQGRVCNIYFGTFSTGAILQEGGSYILLQDGSKINIQDGSAGFNQMFSGYMDQMNIVDAGDTATIELMVENRLIDLERVRVARFTSGYQKSIYPNDKGLDFVEDLQDKNIAWGRKKVTDNMQVEQFILKYWNVPWVRGKHDCIAFAIKYAKECFNVDLSDKELEGYCDLHTAKRAYIMACRKHKVKSFNEYLDNNLIPNLEPSDGCVVAKPDLEGLVGHSYGVIKGEYGFFVDTDGLIPIKLDSKLDLYWKVI